MGFLRFYLALSVVIGHNGNGLFFRHFNPLTAVQAFFIISGFYMALILRTKYTGPGSYRLFISNRLLRLLPAYWAVLLGTVACCFVAKKITGAWPYLDTYKSPLSLSSLFFFLLVNLVLLGQDVVFFLGLDAQGGMFFTSNFRTTRPQAWQLLAVPQAWSLAVELTFYLVAPLLVRRRLAVIVGLLAASLGLRVCMSQSLGLDWDPWNYRFFPTELAYFLLGVVAYHLYEKVSTWNLSRRLQIAVTTLFLGATVTYPYWSALFSPEYTGIAKWSYLAATTLSLPVVFELTKNIKADRYIGELSYPMYIVHFIIIILLHFTSMRMHVPWLKDHSAYPATVLTLIASVLLIRYVVNPIERVRQRRVTAAATSEVVVGADVVRRAA